MDMAAEPLSSVLAEAGLAMTGELDSIGLEPQGALWLHSAVLQDWRYCVISDLVAYLGRPLVYDLIGKALDRVGMLDGLTIFDIHLFEPSEIVPTVLGGAIQIDGLSQVALTNSELNGMMVDALVYRLTPPRTGVALKKGAQVFQKRVAALA
jgi:hypothetical protein